MPMSISKRWKSSLQTPILRRKIGCTLNDFKLYFYISVSQNSPQLFMFNFSKNIKYFIFRSIDQSIRFFAVYDHPSERSTWDLIHYILISIVNEKIFRLSSAVPGFVDLKHGGYGAGWFFVFNFRQLIHLGEPHHFVERSAMWLDGNHLLQELRSADALESFDPLWANILHLL